MAEMLKAIHSQESKATVLTMAKDVVATLKDIKAEGGCEED